MKKITQLALAIVSISFLTAGSLLAGATAASVKDASTPSVACRTMTVNTGSRQGAVTVSCSKYTKDTVACRTACEKAK